jgi:hypothetical protein
MMFFFSKTQNWNQDFFIKKKTEYMALRIVNLMKPCQTL